MPHKNGEAGFDLQYSHMRLIPAHGRQGQEVPETPWQASFAELLSSRLSERPWLTKDSGELSGRASDVDTGTCTQM